MNKINKLLVIRLSSLGDVLLTTPVLRALKNKFPDAEIDFIVKEEYHDAVRLNSNLHNVYLYKKNTNENDFLTEIKKNNYDAVIDLQNNGRSKKIRNKISSKKYFYKKNNLRKFLLVNFKYRSNNQILSVPERYAASIPGLTLDKKGAELFLPEDLTSRLKDLKSCIGLCPGSRHYSKMYPEEYFIELAKLILKSGKQVVLFGGKDDEEINTKIAAQIPEAINLTNNNKLLQTATDMKFCDAVICNDSGLMHTATAVQVPVIAIFGSTVKDFGFAPYNSSNLILENKSLNCRPCSHIGKDKCPKGHFKCMKEIDPQIVYESLTNLLSENV